MAKKATILTQQRVDNIALGEELWDGQVTGLGIRAGAKKTVWRVKVPIAKDGKYWSYKSETIGDARTFTLDQARTEARIRIGRMLERYGDPDQIESEREAQKVTLGTAWTGYIHRCRQKQRSARTIEEYEAMLVRHFDDWRERPLSELGTDKGRADFKKRFDTITRRRGRAAANGAVSAFRAVWNHERRTTTSLPESPTKVLDGVHKLEARKVGYTPEELPAAIEAIWKLDNIRAGLHFALFLTGVRGGGLRMSLRSDYDRYAKTLLLRHHKGKEHVIPLSNALVSLLDCMVAFGEETFPNVEYLFPAHSATGMIVDARAALPPPVALIENRRRLGKRTDGDLKTHFWRNTYISIVEDVLDIPEKDCRRLVGHSTGARDAHAGYKATYLPRLIEKQEQASKGLLRLAGLGEDFRFTPADFIKHRREELGRRRLERAVADRELVGLI